MLVYRSVVNSDGNCEDICSKIAMQKASIDKSKLIWSSLNLNLWKRNGLSGVGYSMHQRLGLLTEAEKTVRSQLSLDMHKNAEDQLEGQSNKYEF